MLDNIPAELKALRQFVVWQLETRINDKQEEKTTKIPYCATNGLKASVTEPATWCDFDTAVLAAESGLYSGIGFVITEKDPYCFIDLDDTEGDQESLNRQIEIYNWFDSYTETSPSGNGAHIIVKGSVEQGRRRSKVEIYSSERFMTMTGNVVNAKPIQDRQELLSILWAEMGTNRAGSVEFIDAGVNGEMTREDNEVLSMACNASNGDRVIALVRGEWQDRFSSQSEADFALINNIAYYTNNREQVMRIFRSTALGKREKAQRDDYVGRMVNRSFDRKLPPIDISMVRNKLAEYVSSRNAAMAVIPVDNGETYSTPRIAPELPTVASSSIPLPPGLTGELALYIYNAAIRPVPEVAIAAALGLMAGVCGRSYNTFTDTGLNLYMLLLAVTGTGKEAMAKGIESLLGAVSAELQNADKFMGPGKINSRQALTKYLNADYGSNSFVTLTGEYVTELKQMTAWNAQPHMIDLKGLLLDLYNKSGHGAKVRPSIFSDRDKSTSVIHSPAVTILGETAPEPFYEALDESMISGGLLTRFNIIEYHGDRPPINERRITTPDPEMITRFKTLCAHSMALNNSNAVVKAMPDEAAGHMLDQFNLYCDEQIRGAIEVKRQLWNRAHVKALKIASLLAVGVNSYKPVITAEMAKWAIDLCVHDSQSIGDKFEKGQVGLNTIESSQREDALRLMGKYFLCENSERYGKFKGYQVEKDLADAGFMPNAYVLRSLRTISSFKNDKRGAKAAIESMLREMQDNGEIENLGVNHPSRGTRRGKIWICLKPEAFDV